MDTYMAKDLPFPESPVVPEMVDGSKTIQFQCRKGIACWNACCSNIDIALTPVDIVRLKQRLGLASWQFALVVLALMIVIQQLENHLLVPRIVGGALDLHPIIVIVGLFMGASLAGILGAILAAPIIASLKLFGNYAWRKLFDLPPFPDDEPPDQAEPPPHPYQPE